MKDSKLLEAHMPLFVNHNCFAPVSRFVACWTVASVATMLAGCGGSSAPSVAGTPPGNAPPTVDTAGALPAAGSANPAEASVRPSVNSKHRRDEVWVDDKGQKWFGNVPMDAFFDEPYTVANDQTPITGTPSTTIASNATLANSAVASTPDNSSTSSNSDGAMNTPPAESSASTAPVTTQGDSWPALISLSSIDDEVKSIRNFLKENVESVGTFNSSMLMIPPKAAALGALAEVAIQYPEAVSWKDDAKYIRDLAKKMNSSALQRGAKDQKRMLGLYEAVSDTLNRSKPAGLDEPPESDSFAEVSEMRLLMMRMEEANNKMKTEAGTESTMGSKKDMIAHEASLLAVMAKIVTLPGYGYEDDAVFKGFGQDIVMASQAIKVAAEANDFAGYESALSKIATTCQDCHSKYKND